VKLLKIIREENIRLQENVSLILNTAFYEEKTIQLNKEALNINEIISRTAALFDSEIMDRRAKIDYDLDINIPIVYIDETHFTNVIFNLMDNAIKYSGETTQINISTFVKDNNVVLSIQDNGIGIPTKSIKHIFDKFYRVPTGKIHDVKGFGLGLTYVKYIIDAHESKISVESKPDLGSTFTISIPIKK
jgi:two-component system phosphate regulon sensor histidine kinase PhoR